MTIRIGTQAPDFDAEAWLRGEPTLRKVRLQDFRGSCLVISFFSQDFANGCKREMAALANADEDFSALGAKILGVSTENHVELRSSVESEPSLRGVQFPVIVDSARTVSESFGVLMDDGAVAHGTFIIGPDGTLLHLEISPPEAGTHVGESLRILTALKAAGPLTTSAKRPVYDKWLAKALPGLPMGALAEATARLRAFGYRSGDIIFSQGDPPDAFYIIAEGQAIVSRKDGDGRETVIASVGPGEFFGEMGLVTETGRSATVRAKSDLQLLALDWEYVAQLMESHVSAGDAFAKIVLDRANR